MADTTTHLTAEQVLALVNAKITEYGDVKAAATAWGCSQAFVYMVRKAERPPSDRMLADVGVRSVTVPASQHYELIPEEEKTQGE